MPHRGCCCFCHPLCPPPAPPISSVLLSSFLRILSPVPGSHTYDVSRSKFPKLNWPLWRENRSVGLSLLLNVLTIRLLTDDWNLKGFCFSLILNIVLLRAEGRNPGLIRGADALCGLPASWKMLSTLSGHLKLEKHIKCRGKKVLNTLLSPFGYII